MNFKEMIIIFISRDGHLEGSQERPGAPSPGTPSLPRRDGLEFYLEGFELPKLESVRGLDPE